MASQENMDNIFYLIRTGRVVGKPYYWRGEGKRKKVDGLLAFPRIESAIPALNSPSFSFF